MWFHSLSASWKSGRSHGPRQQLRPVRRGTRLVLEHLEDRSLPSSYTAYTTADLIADINLSNASGGANTITLAAPTTSHYALTAVDNTTDGPTGLPVIAAGDNLTIIGNGDTIERTGGPAFRLLDVAFEASLTLANLTLQGGEAYSAYLGGTAEGGAISSSGTLILNGVTVQGNEAIGNADSFGSPTKPAAAGGGIFSGGGSVTLTGGTILQNNSASGGTDYGGYGGNAFGGGLYAIGATVTVTNATLDNNTAQAGLGRQDFRQDGYAEGGGLYFASDPNTGGGTLTLTNVTLDGNMARLPENNIFGGGGAFGGGLYLYRATATLTNCTVQGNSALALPGNHGSPGEGGGLFIYYGAVTLDSATVNQSKGNTASSGAKYDNIVGPYTKTH